jgi:protein dithiol:quinone oxidoreductase
MTTNRKLLIAIALTCFALIAGALYFQHVKNMAPCPLCVIQRYAFLFAGILALVAAFVRKPTAWIALSLASALGGVVTVGKHLYVLSNPKFTCGIDPYQNFLNDLPTAKVMPWLFESDGLCEAAGDLVMGLSIPHWSALWFAIITSGLVVALVRRNK